MPKIEQTMPDDFVRSHTLRFITPDMHVVPSDKSTAWAKEALKAWKDKSPWRVARQE